MYVTLAFCVAKEGKKEQLILAATDHASALRQQPGCIATYVLDERGTPDQIAMSVFDSEEAFRKATKATLPIIAAHHLEALLDSPPQFRYFDAR